jgi:hypothetical protein
MFIPKAIETLKNKDIENTRYYMTNRNTRISYGIQYLMLALFLSITVFQIHENMTAALPH